MKLLDLSAHVAGTRQGQSYEVNSLTSPKTSGSAKFLAVSVEDKCLCCSQEIDLQERETCARLHTAGHALADVICKRLPSWRAIKGNHFPGGQAFVAFENCGSFDKATFTAEVEQDLLELIADKRKVGTRLCSHCQFCTISTAYLLTCEHAGPE